MDNIKISKRYVYPVFIFCIGLLKINTDVIIIHNKPITLDPESAGSPTTIKIFANISVDKIISIKNTRKENVL